MSSSRPKDLPDFERPPLDEVVLGIQFSDMPFRNHHAGLLWQLFPEYPLVEEQPPIGAVFETFGSTFPVPDIPKFQIMTAPDALRYWFISEDKCQLLQVQPDRLIHNWRRRREEDEYPRYENVRHRFVAEVGKVQGFFIDRGWGEIRTNQCEVTYINIIGPSDAVADPVRDLAEILTFVKEQYSDGNLSHIERGQLQMSFLMEKGDGGEPLGRLHVATKPVMKQLNGAQALQLTITARGRPSGESVEAALQWLDVGRVAVVKAFASLTTKKMHKAWRRKS
jgi:uncharacterized protein (TIGR04255 family)